MTRLLIIPPEARFFLTHRLVVAKAAHEAGYDVHVAAPLDPHSPRDNAGAIETIRAAGLGFHAIPLKRSGVHPLAELRLILAIYRLIGTLCPDIVHCISMKPIIYGGIAAHLRGTRGLVHSVTGLGHTFAAEGLRASLVRAILIRLYGLAFRHPNLKVIFQNTDDRELFVTRTGLKHSSIVMLRGAGADPRRFCPPGVSGKNPPVILFAGRLLITKGLDVFVEAARQMRAAGRKARFVVVGNPDPENPASATGEQLQAWQAEGVIEWWGYRHDMPEVYAQADIVCAPSYYREGIPKSLIEAAMSGLPIVTTDMPGCREIARDGENGIIVPPRDVAATVSALARLLSEPDLRRRMGARSRVIAEAEFTESAFVDGSLAVYRSLGAC